MHRGDPAPRLGGHRINSADPRKLGSIKLGGVSAQARAKLLSIGAAVGFGAAPNVRLSASLRSRR
jgi:hypothetical protein